MVVVKGVWSWRKEEDGNEESVKRAFVLEVYIVMWLELERVMVHCLVVVTGKSLNENSKRESDLQSKERTFRPTHSPGRPYCLQHTFLFDIFTPSFFGFAQLETSKYILTSNSSFA